MWGVLARNIIRFRVSIIVTLSLFTALMLYQAGGVRLHYGLPRMLPDDDPAVLAYQEFTERFKEESTVFVIGIERDLFQDVGLFNEWYKLGRDVSQVDGVDTVLSIGSAFNIVKDTAAKRFAIEGIVHGEVKTQAELDTLRETFNALPFYQGLLYNPDNNYSLMAISMRNDRFNSTDRSAFFGAVLEQVEKFEKNNGIEVKYSGMPYIREMMTSLVKKELKLFIVLTLIVTVVILALFFRSVKPMLISMLVLSVGVVWSLGIMNWLGYEISILTSLIPPLIIVIGVPNCIYLINQFHSELNTHGNKAKALVRVVSRIGKATFLTNANTAVGFITFVFTESVILVEFGIVAAICTMFLFVLSLLIIIICFSYMAPPKEKFTEHLERGWITGLNAWLVNIITRHRKLVYVTFTLVCVASAYGITKIVTTGNIVDDLPKNHPIVNHLHWFEEHFGGVVPFEIEVNANKPRQILKTQMLNAINECEKVFVDDPSFSKPLSIVDAIKFIRQAFYNGNPERYDLVSSREKAFFKDYIENAEMNQSLLKSFLDSTQQYARISLQVADIGTVEMDSLLAVLTPRIDHIFNPKRVKQDSLVATIAASTDAHFQDSLAHHILDRNTGAKHAFERLMTADDTNKGFDISALKIGSDAELFTQLQAALDEEYTKIVITGPSITFLKGTNYLIWNLFESLALAIVIISLMMAPVFNSLRMILVSMLINFIPLVFTAGVMGYFGIAIKPSTLLVFNLAYGISVDNTIHFLAIYRQELRHTKNDIGLAVRNSLKEAGVSMLYTSVILFFGFSVFDLSQFGGTQALGILVSMTLFVAMFCNLVLLPAILMSFERRMITKAFEEPYFTILDEDEDLELDDLDFGEKEKPQP